uniref:Uncharacterized protein n=1 Tax=Arundo donax TaxID=35708 RepID=A0A0A9BL94_ARUDO
MHDAVLFIYIFFQVTLYATLSFRDNNYKKKNPHRCFAFP